MRLANATATVEDMLKGGRGGLWCTASGVTARPASLPCIRKNEQRPASSSPV